MRPTSPAPSWSIVGIALLAACAWLSRGSLDPAGAFLFPIGVALFVYFPGALVLHAFRSGREEPNPLLALAAGFPAGLACYYLASPVLPAHGYLALTAVGFGLVALLRPRWLGLGGAVPRPAPALAASAAALLLLWPLSLTSFRSVEADRAGGLRYLHSTDVENLKIGGSDAFFHAGVTSALARSSRPPRNPFLVGAPLAYHYGMDLLASAFDRELGIPPLDLAARLLPALFVMTLSGLVFQLARALGLSPAYGLLAVALTFASDFRLLLYLLPLRPEWSDTYWLSYFAAYPSTTYYWTNPHLPALVVFTAGLVCLTRPGLGLRGSALTGVLLGATALFKVFLALHVALVLPLVAVLSWLRSRRRDLVVVTAVAAVVMIAVVFGNRLYGGSEVALRFAWLEPARASFVAVGLEPMAEALKEVSLRAIAVTAAYLVMLMGVRVAAVPFSLRVLTRRADGPALSFLALFFLAGWIPPLLLVVSVSGMNNAFWFTNQSLFAGAPLLALALSRISSPLWRRAACTATLAFALVPTARDVAFRGNQPQARWPQGELEAALYLREQSEAGSVVLHPVNRESPSPASHVAGRSSVLTYWQGYPFSFAPREEVERRASDVAEFFRTSDPAAARRILRKYGVGWVYAPKSRPLRFPSREVLEEVFGNEEATLYRCF